MKTYFYDRTAYLLSDEPVPGCFLKLDDKFSMKFSSSQIALTHRNVVLAESICSRIADVEMYAFLLDDARRRHSIDPQEDVKAAIMTRSFLVGYLGACKALLDSGAVALGQLYPLTLKKEEYTFVNSNFWHQLVLEAPAVHRRYHPLRLFFNEVANWYNAPLEHLAPLVLLQHHYGQFPSREVQLKVIEQANLELADLAIEPFRAAWIDPLQLHKKWKPQFLSLAEKLCLDIELNI